MQRAVEYAGVVENGKLPLAVGQLIAKAIRGMEGKRLVISIREQKRRRSNNQNRYYWGVVIPAVAEMFREHGNATDEEEVHSYLKEHVGGLNRLLIDPDGKRRPVVRSSASLNTAEFEEFMEKVRAWAAGFGYQIPLPNESTTYGEVEWQAQ